MSKFASKELETPTESVLGQIQTTEYGKYKHKTITNTNIGI